MLLLCCHSKVELNETQCDLRGAHTPGKGLFHCRVRRRGARGRRERQKWLVPELGNGGVGGGGG